MRWGCEISDPEQGPASSAFAGVWEIHCHFSDDSEINYYQYLSQHRRHCQQIAYLNVAFVRQMGGTLTRRQTVECWWKKELTEKFVNNNRSCWGEKMSTTRKNKGDDILTIYSYATHENSAPWIPVNQIATGYSLTSSSWSLFFMRRNSWKFHWPCHHPHPSDFANASHPRAGPQNSRNSPRVRSESFGKKNLEFPWIIRIRWVNSLSFL